MTPTLARLLAHTPRALPPLALTAAVLAVIVPSTALASRSDLLLGVLVLATAMGIPASELAGLRRHTGTVVVLSIAPVIVLGAVAWLLGRAFDAPTREGLLAVGLASAEVASVGLVALAGADATIALGVVTGSLVLSAVLAPVAIGMIAGPSSHGGTGHLLGRFALVVILPLVAGVTIRTTAPHLSRADPQREGVAALAVAILVYAALSGTDGARGLSSALVASLAFLAVSAVLATLWGRTRGGAAAVPGALTIGMRDFAVAAALASQAFGSRAGAVPGVYGVVMLLAGTTAAGAIGRRSLSSAHDHLSR